MKIKTLFVKISLDVGLKQSDLNLRHILVDTIERRDLGEVVEETSSPDALELVIEHPDNINTQEELVRFLNLLGFNDYEMEYILSEEDS